METLASCLFRANLKLDQYLQKFVEETLYLIVLLLIPPEESCDTDLRWSGLGTIFNNSISAIQLRSRAEKEFIQIFEQRYAIPERQIPSNSSENNGISTEDILQAFLSPTKVSSYLY